MTLAKDLGKLLASGLLLLFVMLGLGTLLTSSLLDGPVGRLDDRIETELAQSRSGTGLSLSAAGSSLADPRTVQVLLLVLIVGSALLTRRLRPPLVVGFCRMYRGYHHLTDVLAGLVLGGVWLSLCTRYVLHPRRPA